MVSFFTIEIIQRVRTNQSALRYRHTPLIAVGLIVCIANRIVGHDVKDHVLGGVIGDLVRLTRFENKCVASLNRSSPVFMADDAAARNHMIELPLCAVRMIRIGSLPRRNTQNLDIKGMPLVEVGGLGLASQRL